MNNKSRRSKPNVYIGDPGPQLGTYIDHDIANALKAKEANIDQILAGMSEEEIFNTLIALGGNAVEALGIDKCYEHVNMKELAGKGISGLNYATDVAYCKNCFGYFYQKG